MSTTDALAITSAPDALTRYYYAKEREESAVQRINDSYLEALNSLEKLEAENAKLREMLAEDNKELAKLWRVIDYLYSFAKTCGVDAEDMRELGVEVD